MDTVNGIGPKMESVVSHLKEELSTVRTNRPSPKLVENIKVNYFGQDTPVQQLGSIAVHPPRQIVITCWDKGVVEAVANAIQNSGTGISASADGTVVRANLPILSDERRKELEKLIKSMSEESRIALRSLRDTANKEIDGAFKKKEISEDERFRMKEKVQKTTEEKNKAIETLLDKKIAEIHE
jgi:ribosome recycling factor